MKKRRRKSRRRNSRSQKEEVQEKEEKGVYYGDAEGTLMWYSVRASYICWISSNSQSASMDSATSGVSSSAVRTTSKCS